MESLSLILEALAHHAELTIWLLIADTATITSAASFVAFAFAVPYGMQSLCPPIRTITVRGYAKI